MKTTTSPRVLLTAALAAATLLSACGGGATSPQASEAADPTSSSPVAETDAEQAGDAPEGEPLRVVFLTNESGPYAGLSEDAVLGVQAKVEAINAAGGVLGRPLEFEQINTESDPTRATAVAESIEPSEDLIGVVGPEGAATCYAARAVLVEKSIVHYCNTGAPIPGAPDGIVPGEPSPYYFSLHPPLGAAGAGVPFEWMADQGLTRVGLLTSSDAAGQLYRQVTDAEAGDYDIEIVASEEFDATAADVTPQVTNLRSANPDVLYIGTTGGGLATALQAVRDLGMDIPVWTGWGNAADSVAQLVADRLPSGGLFTYGEPVHLLPEVPDESAQAGALQEAEALWNEKFEEGLSVDGALMWDAVSILTQAVEQAGTTDPDAVVEQMESLEEQTGLAGIYDFSPENHRGTRSSGLVIEFTSDGDFRLAAQVDD